MSRRLITTQWPFRRALSLLVGGSLTYAAFAYRKPLANDSRDGKQWPRTSKILTQPNPLREKHAEDENPPPEQTTTSTTSSSDDDIPLFDADPDNSAWGSLSERVENARAALNAITWSRVGDDIADFLLPDWTLDLPGYFSKLQRELEMAPGSLAEEIWEEAQDPALNPEIARVAKVRISKDLCKEEKMFRRKRARYTTRALAKYLGIPEADVDPEDVPTIAVCGSGGGLRALVAGTSSYLSAQEAGLFDCVTYTAGVSGSCWAQALYYSTIGNQSFGTLLHHLKRRIGTHIAYPPAALSLLTAAPTNKFLLSGILEKVKGDPTAELGLVDVYGILLAARLLVPRGELGVDSRNLKLSNQQIYVQDGAHPLPIYTAVRHEIPVEENEQGDVNGVEAASPATKEKAKQEAWFQWFESTPYELWSEEIEAGIPSWSVGRQFHNGIGTMRDNGLSVPELRLPFMLGIWGSAFCATLSHYYKEIRPVVKGVVGFGGIDDLLEEKNDELIRVHPIEPAAIPNYVLGLEDQLPATAAKSIFKSDHLELADAGMSNNLPIYPLLRPGRDVDILIAFDASADIKTENWLSVADGYARQRGIKGWPVGAGWPKAEKPKATTADELDAVEAMSAQQAAGKIADAREEKRKNPIEAVNNSQPTDDKTGNDDDEENPTDPSTDLTYCNIWVGTTLERTSTQEPPPSKRLFASPSPSPSSSSSPSSTSSSSDDEDNWHLTSPHAGLALIYFPFLPNPSVTGVDPNTSDFMSTWNFIYTPEQIQKVVSLARANFREGEEKVKRVVRAVYERKRARRLEAERRGLDTRWRGRWKKEGDQFR
ncbi:MAG: hypothetical protein LQ343_005149 [Gyalolechia ehrenbergii]|nr:MAG: hypothetical protein LQ343_005149 [Gyalolechia ehrenbergii]